VDSTIVVTTAIAGAVGVAGVAGTIIAARIAGNSARESARLTIAAEDRRGRFADKRQGYARFMEAFTTAWQVATEAKSSEDGSSFRANFAAARRDLIIQMNELILIGPLPVAQLVRQAADRLDDYWQGKCDDTAIKDARNKAFNALRADLDEDAKRGGG
jgi:hypothetical protein